MCRLFLAINQNLDKDTIMNFFSQSKDKKNTPGLSNPLDADYHLDGYGVCWFEPDGELLLYKSASSYNQDENFPDIFDQFVNSRFILAHLRNKGKISVGNPNISNSHPFICSNYIFAHNGFIKNFPDCKNKILNWISDKYSQKICGETDTEHLFYCLLTIIDDLKKENTEHKDEEIYKIALRNLFKLFNDNFIELVGNFIFSDFNVVVVIRYISPNFKTDGLADVFCLGQTDNLEPPSLYFCSDILKNSVIVCSEPVNSNYLLVEPNSFITFQI